MKCPECGAPVQIAVEAGYEVNEWDVQCSAHPCLHEIEKPLRGEPVVVVPRTVADALAEAADAAVCLNSPDPYDLITAKLIARLNALGEVVDVYRGLVPPLDSPARQ